MIPARVRPGRPVIVAAVAVTALIGGAGASFAATSSSLSAPQAAAKAGTAAATPPPTPSRCQIRLPWRGLPPPGPLSALPGAPGELGFGPFGAVHGQFVAPRPGGGYQTIDAQRGTVTAVSTGAITVHSGDGYTKTYQVTSTTNVDGQRAGIGSVKTGQTVSVLATVNGPSATATQIVDVAALPNPPKVPKALTPGFRHVLRFGPCASWSISR